MVGTVSGNNTVTYGATSVANVLPPPGRWRLCGRVRPDARRRTSTPNANSGADLLSATVDAVALRLAGARVYVDSIADTDVSGAWRWRA